MVVVLLDQESAQSGDQQKAAEPGIQDLVRHMMPKQEGERCRIDNRNDNADMGLGVDEVDQFGLNML